jgi:hypothetical protein
MNEKQTVALKGDIKQPQDHKQKRETLKKPEGAEYLTPLHKLQPSKIARLMHHAREVSNDGVVSLEAMADLFDFVSDPANGFVADPEGLNEFTLGVKGYPRMQEIVGWLLTEVGEGMPSADG